MAKVRASLGSPAHRQVTQTPTDSHQASFSALSAQWLLLTFLGHLGALCGKACDSASVGYLAVLKEDWYVWGIEKRPHIAVIAPWLGDPAQSLG